MSDPAPFSFNLCPVGTRSEIPGCNLSCLGQGLKVGEMLPLGEGDHVEPEEDTRLSSALPLAPWWP